MIKNPKPRYFVPPQRPRATLTRTEHNAEGYDRGQEIAARQAAENCMAEAFGRPARCFGFGDALSRDGDRIILE